MAFGTLGSTLNDELNRLANGGTYRDKDDMVDEALAAKQWANRENIVPYSTDTVGILNEIAALGPNRQNWFDFNGVCNYLAGTTGLPAAAALRQITTTGDILTSLAGFYTDAATPRYNYPGYIYISDVSGQYVSVPDETALDITGDIDLRVKLAADDWTPAVSGVLLSKTAGSNYSWAFSLQTDGRLNLYWSTDGGTGAGLVGPKISTVAPTVTNGSPLWVRVTLDVNNGASGNDVKFFTSTDGTTWTQLGSTVTTAGVTSIFSGNAQVQINAQSNANAVIGKVYNAQIFASLDGTDKRLDVDLTTNVTSATYDQFTATTGQLCTINGQNTLTNGGSAGALLPITVGSSLAADSNDAKFLDHTGTNYVYLPNVASNYMFVPYSSSFNSDDLDIQVNVAMDDWTPASNQRLAGLWTSATGNNRGWVFDIQTNGTLFLAISQDGIANNSSASTTSVPFVDGQAGWVRATYRKSDRRVQFFTSTNGTTWTQLGTDLTNASTSIFAANSEFFIGFSGGGGSYLAAKVLRARLFNGIDGTKVLDVDTSVITSGAATSFTAVTGQTVTINRSTSGRKTVAVTQPTWLFGTDDYMEVNNRYMAHSTSDENYVYLSGASGNYMSVADNPPLDITGDLDIQVKVALDDWTPSAENTLTSKWGSGQLSYNLSAGTDGKLYFYWSPNGSTFTSKASTVATGLADGATKWVRVTFDVDNGASGNDIKFYTSDDGTTWTQLGATVTTAGIASIFNSTAVAAIGSNSNGNGPAKGKFYRAIIKNGIDGTTVLDANAAVITLPSQTTFTDSSSNAYTVTINKSGVGTFVSTGNYLYLPGTTTNNYASTPDSAALDITGDLDLRVKLALDDWTPAAASTFIGKWATGSNYSYLLQITNTGTLNFSWTTSGAYSASTDVYSTVATGIADGATRWVRVTLDVDNGASGRDIKFFTSTDGLTWTQLGTTITQAGVTSVYAGTSELSIGADSLGGARPTRGKFFRAQVINGIGGTVAFDANFEGSITSLNQASFTESSSNAATVTINRSGSTYRSAGVIDAGYLYPGATNTFSNSTIDYLNFGATDSFTVLSVARRFGNPATDQRIIMKWNIGAGYLISYITNGATALNITGGGGAGTAISLASGTLGTVVATRNISTDLVSMTSGATTASAADTTTGSLSTVANFAIGRQNFDNSLFADMEFIAAAVFRSVLTASQIRQITNYFANREAYL